MQSSNNPLGRDILLENNAHRQNLSSGPIEGNEWILSRVLVVFQLVVGSTADAGTGAAGVKYLGCRHMNRRSSTENQLPIERCVEGVGCSISMPSYWN